MNTENLQNNASAPDAAACREKINSVISEIEHVIVGKRTEIVMLMTAMLSGSHVLIEDVPGTGKTTLAAAIAKATGLDFRRAQFTPDVMASDIPGFNVYNRRLEEFEFRKGLVMCNLLLADEINRASPKTQSALLEAMEESRVTVDGVTYDIPDPFMVIATQNPTGAKGTQMLPDSQMDRFMLRLSIGYPSPEDEAEMIRRKQKSISLDSVQQVVSKSELMQIRQEVSAVFVKDEVVDYIVQLCGATRNDPRILQGASPRASLALTSLAKATAWIQGRDYVLPRDVRFIFRDCIEHRLLWSDASDPRAHADIMRSIAGSIKAPNI